MFETVSKFFHSKKLSNFYKNLHSSVWICLKPQFIVANSLTESKFFYAEAVKFYQVATFI